MEYEYKKTFGQAIYEGEEKFYKTTIVKNLIDIGYPRHVAIRFAEGEIRFEEDV